MKWVRWWLWQPSGRGMRGMLVTLLMLNIVLWTAAR